MFEELIKRNCFSSDPDDRKKAAEELEYHFGMEIHCTEIDPDVKFAHHGRGCTIVAAKICKGVVIYQNVTIGSNLRYNKILQVWENIGSPIIAENVIICDGAKVLGPITIGENSIIAAGAIITKNIPSNSIAYGTNKYRPKDDSYDLVFSHNNMLQVETIIEVDKKRIEIFKNSKKE